MLEVKKYLWSVANKLVKDYGFSTMHLKSTSIVQQELPIIDLIKNKKNEYIFIRLIPFDYIWTNHMLQDIEETKAKAGKLIKQVYGRKVKFLNLYLFQSTPPNEIHQLISQSSRASENQFEFFLGYIDLEKERVGMPEDTFDELKITRDPFVYYFSQPISEEPSHMINEIKEIESKREREFKQVFNYGKPFLTYVFIAINALLFLLMEFSGGSTNTEVLLNYGAKESFLISQGEYWRLITPIFLHIGFLHFALNNIAIYYLGNLAEKIYGSFRFFSIFILAGIIGNISSFLFNASSIGAGASGAIFGLFGALLYFGYIYPDLFFRTMGNDILTIIGINLVFGFVVPNIDNNAHIGGLIGGFIVAAIIHLPKQKSKKWLLSIIAVFIIILTIGATWWGAEVRDFKGSEAIFIKGENALIDGELEKANSIFDHLVTEYPNDPLYHFYYANTVFQQGNPVLARKHYLQTLELDQNFFQAHYNLALISLFENNNEQAIYHLEKALAINPLFKEAIDLLYELEQK